MSGDECTNAYVRHENVAQKHLKKGTQQYKAHSCLLSVCQWVTALSFPQLGVISLSCPTGPVITWNQATPGPISGTR